MSVSVTHIYLSCFDQYSNQQRYYQHTASQWHTAEWLDALAHCSSLRPLRLRWLLTWVEGQPCRTTNLSVFNDPVTHVLSLSTGLTSTALHYWEKCIVFDRRSLLSTIIAYLTCWDFLKEIFHSLCDKCPTVLSRFSVCCLVLPWIVSLKSYDVIFARCDDVMWCFQIWDEKWFQRWMEIIIYKSM